MSRQIISSVMLSCLLLWQLAAGGFVHAHGAASQPASIGSVDTTVASGTQKEHCAAHLTMTEESMRAVASMDMHAHAATDDLRAPDQSDAECCESLFCKCPCVQALALPVFMPHVAAVADAQAALVTVVSLLHAGVSGVFRPPI